MININFPFTNYSISIPPPAPPQTNIPLLSDSVPFFPLSLFSSLCIASHGRLVLCLVSSIYKFPARF